jgi:hypothetical protein
MKFYNLAPRTYEGYRYQIPFYVPVPWKLLNWCMEDSENRRVRCPDVTTECTMYVELKKDEDLTYFQMRWG